MTVFVYVNTAKQVGDADHVKVFANVDAAEKWFEEKRPGRRRIRIRGLGVRLSFPRAYGNPRFTNSASAASGVRSKVCSIRRRRPRVPGFFPTSEPANLDDASPTGLESNCPQPSIS